MSLRPPDSEELRGLSMYEPASEAQERFPIETDCLVWWVEGYPAKTYDSRSVAEYHARRLWLKVNG